MTLPAKGLVVGRKRRIVKVGWRGIGAVVALLLLGLAVLLQRGAPPSPEILCVGYTPSPVSSLELERVFLDEVRVTLRNEGGAPCRMGALVLTLGGKEVSGWAWGELRPGEEREFTLPCRYATVEGGLYPLTPYSEGARWVELGPGESVEGFFTFQIPEGERPLEASFQCVKALVRF